MDDPKLFREQIQKSIIDLISEGMEDGSITDERAKEIAKYVLEVLPEGIDMAKLMQVIPTLDDNFVELASIVLPIMREYEFKVKNAINERITGLIKEGKFDDALNLTKRAIEEEKSLT